ncbi:MAG: CheR family methyltransferase [Beijerinckiaceae bacterium]
MTEADLALFQSFILQRTGIVLTPEKRYLVETRLDPIVRKMQLPSLGALAAKLRLGDRAVETAVIDAMTTNETLFFRDKLPFDQFQNIILPKLIAARRQTGRIRIWCAACSTGQEPYSLSMMLDEMRSELAGIQVEILATDISEKVIAAAKEGVYSQFEVQRGLPIRMLMKYFNQVETRWKINPLMGDRIQFRQLNLLQPFKNLGTFDVIFCRNVLIYFGEATKRDVLDRLSESLSPDGYLLLGGAETVLGLAKGLSPHKLERSLYVHKDSAEAHSASFVRPRLIA